MCARDIHLCPNIRTHTFYTAYIKDVNEEDREYVSL